jgi:hypothetical protein
MSSGLSTTILILQILSTFIGSAGFSDFGCILANLELLVNTCYSSMIRSNDENNVKKQPLLHFTRGP